MNAITRLISVLFPEPLEPTSAVVVPAGAWNADAASARARPALYSKVTSSKTIVAVDTSDSGERAPSSSSSVGIVSISRMRSRPANASLICVPIEAICMTGAATRPVKKM